MNLFNKVYKFYCDHFDDLKSKKFHFASRLFLWNGDTFFAKKIQEIKPQFLAEGFLSRDYTNRSEALAKFDQNRLMHLEKFPRLLEWHDVLIQGMYAQTVFGVDYLPEVKQMLNEKDQLNLCRQLQEDREALAWLATYATSYLFFVYRYFLSNEDDLDLAYLIDVGQKSFDIENTYELNLKIYYFTHCIIGESLFYSRQIPEKHLSSHRQIIKIVESLIENNFTRTHVDHKLEFLMCCHLCHYQSHLEVKIYDEIENSVSQNGDFVVDALNEYKDKRGNFNLYEAEHQNVLFLMAKQGYNPNQGRLDQSTL